MRSAFGTVVSLLLLSASVTAQSREFSRTVELDPSGALRVVGAIGSIRITSWEQPQVEIRARIERPDQVSDEYATRAIDATSIEVTGDRRAVSVVSNYSKVPVLHLRRGSYGRRDPPVHYEIRAPRKIVLNVDSDRGPLTVSGFEGVFDIVADRGTLDLRDVGGDLRIDIDRGERSRIDGLRGRIRLQADRTNLDINAPSLDTDSRIEIDRGHIELSVTRGQQLTVRIDVSRRRRLHTDFPIQWRSAEPRQSEGHINGGGAELFVELGRATVDLRRRQN
jgi:hypothetical protein